ncbi:ABC transporter ATP-binding protein [Azorhizobium oxalatiphilum]|uniref:ABC transporter ATP-binding protein n=1 Tax=Azorhizobium oxalatiphilum TaxID=980631 RepID=A0A917F865_9HYPH|nr:ABC transporter ATP-binding protein [Azorhizobium oxalatiphilum]GGF54855.1 ABC transporter ATP-binding protein [Azorhizobium oxalatiphilum]
MSVVHALPDATSGTAPVLEARALAARYGHVEALHPIDLHVAEGELVAVLGPNGAGKSTLLRAILGLVSNSGTVSLRGTPLPRQNPVAVASRGVVLVPEGRGIFGPMSVAENLELGAYRLRDRAEFARRRERVMTLFPRLKERLTQVAGSMSGGEQQMLAIGRALMAGPQVLLLDEPSLGLAPRVTEEILATLGTLNGEGLSIILVEQKAPLALELANRAYLLSVGRIVATLDPREITSYDELAQHYFA